MPTELPPQNTSRPQRRKALNVVGIKQTTVVLTAILTAFGSILTGLGMHIAYSPMLVWMLGWSGDKAQGVALRVSACAAFAGVLGYLVMKPAMVSLLLAGVVVFWGAAVGAILAAKLSQKLASQTRLFQVVGIGFMLFMIVQTAQRNAFSPSFGASLTPALLWLLLGLGAGALSQSLTLPSGLLLIPALYYFGGFAPYQAMGIAVVVVALAALLPAWGYTQRGLFEKVYGNPATVGGILGGVLGGLVLGRWGEASDKGLIYLFATVAMFFCARELARPQAK